jgi:PRTRC genetic system protein E
VNVIPKKISDGENDALTTPVSITGTVEDLDRELPQTLLHFVSSHLELKNSLERAKAEMEEASKAARVEAKKKSGSQTTRKDPAVNFNKPAAVPETPGLAKAEPPKAASLFDSPADPVGLCEADAARASSVESEIDEDEDAEGEADEVDDAA